MDKPLSHVDYLVATARLLVDDPSKMSRAINIGMDQNEKDNLRRAWTSIANSKRFRINSVLAIARAQGLSVSEMFLMPGAVTEWYTDASIDYFRENIVSLREAIGISRHKFCELVGVNGEAARSYEIGRHFPSVIKMQRIADVLGVEIAELFLPPDGIAENGGKSDDDEV